MIKKIIGWLVLATLGAGSICGIVYGCKYHDLNNEYQTTDQLRNTVDELNTLTRNLKIQVSALEAKEEELTTQNEELKLQVAELQTQVEENVGNAELVVELQAQIETLNATIEENNSKISTLTTERNNLSARVSELESQVAQLETTLENSEAENEDYVLQIATLEAQITSLQNEITRLNGLMADYEDMKNQAFEVNFYVGDSIVHTDAIKSGNFVEELPSVDLVKYWKLEDGTQIDPLTYEITANTNFYAQTYEVGGYCFAFGSSTGSSINFDELGSGFCYFCSLNPFGVPYMEFTSPILLSIPSDVFGADEFFIEVIGVATVSSTGSAVDMPGSASISSIALSDTIINNPEIHGDSSKISYSKYESKLIKFTKTGYDNPTGKYSYSSSDSDFVFYYDSISHSHGIEIKNNSGKILCLQYYR